MTNKTCKRCGANKPNSAYSKTQNRKRVNVICKSCRRESAKKGRITNWKRKNKHLLTLKAADKTKLVDMFGGSCVMCGYSKCNSALHFHHTNPKDKKFCISAAPKDSEFGQLLEEAMKCILVCSNCHAEIHAGIIKLPQYIVDFCSISQPVVV